MHKSSYTRLYGQKSKKWSLCMKIFEILWKKYFTEWSHVEVIKNPQIWSGIQKLEWEKSSDILKFHDWIDVIYFLKLINTKFYSI